MLVGRQPLGLRGAGRPGNLLGLLLAGGFGRRFAFLAVGRRRLVFAFGGRHGRRVLLGPGGALSGGLLRPDRGEHVGVGAVLVAASGGALRVGGGRTGKPPTWSVD